MSRKSRHEKQMTGLEAIQSLNFCGCGDPSDGYIALRDALDAHHASDLSESAWATRCEKSEAWFTKLGDQNAYLLLYFMTAADLMEHGGSVHGSWLTEKGKLVLEFLNDCGTKSDEW